MPESKDWYSPAEIIFDQKTVLWILHNWGTLRGSRVWPVEPSSYTDMAGRKAPSRKAPFTTPIECTSELGKRLEKCGIDGLMLLAMEAWGESAEVLGKYFRMPAWVITRRATRALHYVASGQARRWHDTKRRPGRTYQGFRIGRSQ